MKGCRLTATLALALATSLGSSQARTAEWGDWTLLCTPLEPVRENYVEARRSFEKDGTRYGIYYRFARLTETRYAEVFNVYSMNPEDEGRFIVVGEKNNRGPAAAFEKQTAGKAKPRDFIVSSVDIDTYVARTGGYVTLVMQDAQTLFWRDQEVLKDFGKIEAAFKERCG